MPSKSDSLVERPRREPAAVQLVNPGDTDVVRIATLIHQPMVFDLSAFLDDYLSHAVIQVCVIAEADVALYDHALGLPSGYDQHSWVGGESPLVGGHEYQVDGAFDPRALCHVDQRAVADERSVERGKPVVLDRCQSTEVPPRDHAIRLDHFWTEA